MSNLTINRIGPEAQADSAWHDEDLEAARFAPLDVRPARMRGRDALGMALAGMVALGGWLVLLLVFALAAWVTERAEPPAPGWALFWRALLAGTASTPLAMAVVGLVMWAYERRTAVRRASIIRDRLMNPVPAHVLDRMTLPSYYALFERAAALERDVAPYRAYRGVESLSLSAGQSRPAAAGEPPALPASVPVDAPDVWIDAVLATEAHLMLAGKTNCGKTTTAEALLAAAIDAGDLVAILDPHAAPGKWHGAPAIGAGRDYEAIRQALAAMEAEMNRRYAALAAGEPLGQPVLIVIDEAPAIAAALGAEWRRFATRLGSEARKIGIRLLLITQSPLVQDLNINTMMRRNFGVIGLDLASIRLMVQSEPDGAARRAILDRLEGERYPALYERYGQFRILDRTGIDRIRPTRTPRVWRLVSSPAALPATGDAGDGDAQGDEAALLAVLRKLRSAGVTRDEARALGVEFRNELWALAAPRDDAQDAPPAAEDRAQDAPRMHAAPAVPASASERAACAQGDALLAELLSRCAAPPAPAEMVRCARCGAEVPVPAGKAAMAVRAATGRHGCPACRAEGRHATP